MVRKTVERDPVALLRVPCDGQGNMAMFTLRVFCYGQRYTGTSAPGVVLLHLNSEISLLGHWGFQSSRDPLPDAFLGPLWL